MKKATMSISLNTDTTEFLQRVLADSEGSQDQSAYINDLIRRDRDRRGIAAHHPADEDEKVPQGTLDMLERQQEEDIPAGG